MNQLTGNPLNKTEIVVSVCGLKNVIVQNDESVQDVNAPIYPFGTRPRVGASFYIGSKELFSKNWEEVYVNAEWKDKPKDFGLHYKHYSYKDTIFEDGSKEIVNSSFLTTAFVLDKGQWKKNGQRRLFKVIGTEMARTKPLPVGFPAVPAKVEVQATFCPPAALPDHVDVYDYSSGVFGGLSAYERRNDLLTPLLPLNVASQYGFLRFTLDGISFQYDIFPFVLTRQMMAYAGLLSLDIIQELVTRANIAKKIIDEMILEINRISAHIGNIQTHLGSITVDINTINQLIVFLQGHLNSADFFLNRNLPGDIALAINEINQAITHVTNISNAIVHLTGEGNGIQGELNFIVSDLSRDPGGAFDPNNVNFYGLTRLSAELKAIIEFFVANLQVDPTLKDGLPSEPYTPVIKTISIDYKAKADINDINFIHLYPYTHTYKAEELSLQPTLFATHCNEGNLFIGLKDLVPGSNLNMLFQLAEATSDTEFDREKVNWHYLDNNQWKSLRTGFEILEDATDGLTASGIVKFAMPQNMTIENTVLPKGLHWIKASVAKNSRTVSETLGIHTQAVAVTFTNEDANYKLRLSKPLKAGSISKLQEADALVKKIVQPYDSFGGRIPEAQGHFYIRTSEWLRHKGRAIQKFDYERLTLEKFPQLYKVKCINHSFALNAYQYKNDFPIAPGYIILAVIPDLNQLKAAESFEPKAPVSILDDIQTYFKTISSPFVRLRAMNPRYEKIHFCLKVKLHNGKDENYYKEKLGQEIREFLAPWAIGEYHKLTFGQCVHRSDIIQFIETRDYVDFIVELRMRHDTVSWVDAMNPAVLLNPICPKTPRSILIAGDIDICIPEKQCEEWTICYSDTNNKIEIDCCDNKKVMVSDYCGKEK